VATVTTCTHCGTTETPRWWKDNFPMGTLCNACGIWLKRHGYPRPVQFFINHGAAPGNPAAAHAQTAHAAAARAHQAAMAARVASVAPGSGPDADSEFYLINGRPKRRRAGPHAVAHAAAAAAAAAGMHVDAADATADPPINYQSAGARVFVLRRKLLRSEVATPAADSASPSSTPASTTSAGAAAASETAPVVAALVHFGWSPVARAAHEMYGRAAAYGDASPLVSVDDFELMSECKATATLRARPGAATPESWDSVVRDFVERL
jgi:hypothetical protein